MYPSIEDTANALGEDGRNYKALFGDFVEKWDELVEDALAPMRWPKHLFLFAKFGKLAIRSARAVARAYFRTERARTLFAGIAAHATLPLEKAATAGFALVLATSGHAKGWPFVQGGAQQLTNALISYFQSLGGQIITNCKVESLDQLPPARAILLDITPRQLLQIGGNRLPESYKHKLSEYRYTMGVFKMDWALHQPVPWRAQECSKAGTIHLGGSLDEISDSERAAWNGKHSERPFVLLAQPSVFDSSRAPAGKHTLWGYCHLPNGSTQSMVEAIENQIERYAPGFRHCVLARSALTPADMERRNANLVGGDISGGASTLDQLFFRPTATLYKTPAPGVYLCSSSTPPGGGVHGMCGYFAAEAALVGASNK
jgi:phytoene dehydrogenase-like protein